MSAIYRQSPDEQRPAEMSSQSLVGIGNFTRPRTVPLGSRAKSTAAFPESLCDHSSPGVRWLIARPLDSGRSGNNAGPETTVHGPGLSLGRMVQAITRAPAITTAPK